MTPIEPASPPRKASWKRWVIAFACVLVIAAVALFLKAPAPEPVTVTFLRSTNYNGQKTLFFQGTNGLSTVTMYRAYVTPTSVKTARASGLAPVYHNAIYDMALPRGTFTFSLDVPQGNTDWCVIWGSSGNDFPQTSWEKVREGCSVLFRGLGMPRVAWRLSVKPHAHYIPATDLKE